MRDFLMMVMQSPYYNMTAQAIWIIAIWVIIYGFTQKDDVRSMKLVTISWTLWLINYLMLWLEAAAYAAIIALLRMYFSFYYKWNKIALYFIISLTLILGYVSYDGLVSILPIIASIWAIFAFQVFHGLQMRIIILLCSFMWLYYMLVVWNTPWIVSELISEVVLLMTIYKIYTLDKETPTLKEQILLHLRRFRERPRRRVDFGRFIIFRDKKRYLDDELDILYEEVKTN